MKSLIIIGGPTGSGKTALSVDVAMEFSCPVISADSRQCYREMKIGTAKPASDEMKGVTHYFIGSHSINEDFNAGTFAEEAGKLIPELLNEHDQLIMTGGSGMYIDALLYGMDDLPGNENDLREKLNRQHEQHGLGPLLNELRDLDPVYFNQVDQHNPQRIIRALEVCKLTGKPYSEHLNQMPSKGIGVPWKMYIIDLPREILYERINQRVDKMFDEGLVEEVMNLKQHWSKNALQTVGYKEVFRFLDGEIGLDEASNLVKQHTRNYAKRQLTWLRRYPDSEWISPEKFSELPSMIRSWQGSPTSGEAN